MGELAFLAAITALTRQHQIPDAVEVRHPVTRRPRNKVIDIGEIRMSALKADRPIAVEAAAFLVAVQAVATAGDIDASLALARKQNLLLTVILHCHQIT